MLFLIHHLFPAPRLLELAAPGLQLPALQILLARGQRISGPAEGVEAALCDALGIARQQDWPVAPITRRADGGEPENGYWLRADPVHLRLLRDRVVLVDPSACALAHDDAALLADAVARHFGATFRPQALHPSRWYVRLPNVPRLATTPPSVAIGLDVNASLPRGEDAAHFRSLMNELQMLLHAHPVNQAREARGELPVNALWLWGGGTLPPAPTASVRVHGDAPQATALAAFAGADWRALGARFNARELSDDSVVILDVLAAAAQNGDAYGWREAVQALERDWCDPLLAALRRRRLQTVRLLDPISGRGVQITARGVWQLWRRPLTLAAALANI